MSSARCSATTPPSALASATVVCRPSALRSVKYNSAPPAASFSAVARPIPLAAPVRNTRLPANVCVTGVTLPGDGVAAPPCGEPELLEHSHAALYITIGPEERDVAREHHCRGGAECTHQCRYVVANRMRCAGGDFIPQDID